MKEDQDVFAFNNKGKSNTPGPSVLTFLQSPVVKFHFGRFRLTYESIFVLHAFGILVWIVTRCIKKKLIREISNGDIELNDLLRQYCDSFRPLLVYNFRTEIFRLA